MKHTPLSAVLLVLLFVAVAWRPEAPPVQKWEYAQLIRSSAGVKPSLYFDTGTGKAEKLEEKEDVAALNYYAAQGWELTGVYTSPGASAYAVAAYYILRRPVE